MTQSRALKQTMRSLKRSLKEAARDAETQSKDRDTSGHNVNVSYRANVAVAKNVGADSSVENVSATQDMGSIRQINPPENSAPLDKS